MPFDPETGEPIEDDERPSLGERIGAKTGAVPPVPAAQPVDSAPAIQLDPAKMPDIMGGGAASSPPSRPPTGSNNPNYVDLLKQQATYGKPLDRGAIDPKSGRQMYKLGLGERLLGTLANFGAGVAGKGPVSYLGPGATNARYDRDEATREANLSNVGTQIQGQEQLDKMNTKAFEDLQRQAYQTEIGEARNKTAEAAQGRADASLQLADTKQQLSASQADLNKARAAQATSTANQKDATRPRQIMGNRVMEKQDDGSWKDVGPAPIKQGGGGRGSKTDFDKIEKDKQKAMRDAESKADKSIAKIKPPSALDYAEFSAYSKNPIAWKEQKKQEVYTELQQDKAQAQADYEARIQEKGGSVAPAKGQTVQTPPPNRVVPAKGGTATPKAPPAVGTTVLVDGKPHKVIGFNQKTNKPIVSPLSGQ